MADPIPPTSNDLVKSFDDSQNQPFLKTVLLPAVVIVLIIVVGGITGYFLSSGKIASPISPSGGGTAGQTSGSSVKEAGIKNPTIYKDKSEGRVEVNDNQDVPEGSHKLIRPGGNSQTAYLVSSALDLNDFVGKCVEVMGETFSSQKAAWFMDVGYARVLDSCPSGL